MRKAILSFASACLMFTGALAQSGESTSDKYHFCGSDDYLKSLSPEEQVLADEALHAFDERVAEELAAKDKRWESEFLIPVVFHVIQHEGFPVVSDANLTKIMTALNQDFNSENVQSEIQDVFRDKVADCNIRFKLAEFDPEGNQMETPGLNIVEAPEELTTNVRDEVKYLTDWGNQRYMNVWVVNSISGNTGNGIVAGFAVFPHLVKLGSTRARQDGIVVIDEIFTNSQLGSTNGTPNFFLHTLTHEVGHWLGLYHPFQGGCASGDCRFTGDRICDIPQEDESHADCAQGRGTLWCNSLDDGISNRLPVNMTNFMSYYECTAMFSPEQKARMRTTLKNERAELVSRENHIEVFGFSTVSVEESFDGIIQSLDIYPNPSNGHFNIEFDSPEFARVNVRAYDMAGRTVGNIVPLTFYQGDNQLSFTAEDLGLSKGIFMLEFELNGRRSVKRVQIID